MPTRRSAPRPSPRCPADDEHLEVLRELARDDEDVQRAAGGRRPARRAPRTSCRWPAASATPELRREYAERLVAVATAPAPTDADAALALDGLDDQKQFAAVAKASPHDTVRTAALGRIHDTRLLSSVARHAADGQTAADAVARIADHAELLNIATKTEHKDAGISALERALEAGTGTDARDTLEGVASRARNKSVVKRARAMLQAMDEEEAARRLALEQWQQRVARIVARVEAIAAAPSTTGAAAQLADAEAEWQTVTGNGAFELDADTSSRFGAVAARAREEITRVEQEAEAPTRGDRQARGAGRARARSSASGSSRRAAKTRSAQIDVARGEWEGMALQSPLTAADQALRTRSTRRAGAPPNAISAARNWRG